MNFQNRNSLMGGLIRYREDAGPELPISKIDILMYAHNDLETAQAALVEWELAGGIQRLADLRTAAPDTAVASVNLQQMYALQLNYYAMIKAVPLEKP